MKSVIVNADDFGASTGVNRGIIDCHLNGVVTSTSLMVTGDASDEAIALARDLPHLSVGLHWDVIGEDEREFDTHDLKAVEDELDRQLNEFERRVGRLPTHIDSHRHLHLKEHVSGFFAELVEPLGIPLRGHSPVSFIGGFYAQWEWKVTNLEYVSVPVLQRILQEEVAEGWTEISCHPGYVSPGYPAVYLEEREHEVRTLLDTRIKETIDELGIRLLNYDDFDAEVNSGAL